MPNALPIAILFAALASSAPAAQFSILGTVQGGAQIGAISGGTLYGTTFYANPPFLFSLTTGGAYAALHSFTADTDGAGPNARLAIDGKGALFGTTASGGQFGGGTIWRYDAAHGFSVRHSFGDTGDGFNPRQGPSLGPKGVLYGSTAMGAPNNNGIVFSLSHAGAYGSVYNFLSGPDGHCPFSGVAAPGSGILYGTTVGVGYGGNPNGSVWQYTPASGLQTIYVFQDGNDGEWPDQAPIVDSHGNLYGTTHVQNGAQFPGAIYAISQAGVFSILRDLNGATDGYGLNSPLLIGPGGLLYGTTSGSGPGGYGTVFSISRAGKFAVVHAFANGSDGAAPTGNLVRDSSGAIYGGTASGQVFKIVP